MNNHQNKAGTVPDFVSEEEFRNGVMPRAQLSKLACEIALEKTINNDVKEFAGWELMEATTVIDTLLDLDTPEVAPGKDAIAFLSRLKTLGGTAFDNEFMAAELSNHEFLRDLAGKYLANPDGKPSGRDKETWHVAGLALFAFTEHVGLCKGIISGLSA